MKKATLRIVNVFPQFKCILEDQSNPSLIEESLRKLNDIEGTFLQLALFFENPNTQDFSLSALYHNLDDDWLELALELITDYFQKDTYLIKKPSYSLIKDGSDYLSLSQFADFLSEEGLRYDRQKINLYYERGKVPKPDLVIGGIKYWSIYTAAQYSEQEKERSKKKIH